MEVFTIFLISTIPAGIALLIYSGYRKRLKNLMKRENTNYTGQINNFIDVFRIIKTVKSSNSINRSERSFLIKILILIGISWVTGVVYILMFIFFHDKILN